MTSSEARMVPWPPLTRDLGVMHSVVFFKHTCQIAFSPYKTISCKDITSLVAPD
ncbi:MAG: hypothetical protein CM1200mP25_0550 [Acidobacteriota bacterium]|nr:MAG: hypothetical protein CM1200mP25_0550 [Acidobacteriota bacterium]